MTEQKEQVVEQPQQKPWPLYIIIGMVFGVMVLGWSLSPKTEEGKLAWIEILGTTNHGALLNPPVEVKTGQLLDSEGNPWEALEDNTWKLLLVAPESCAQACMARLQEMHAMRLRLHRDMDRLTLGLVMPEGISAPEELAYDISVLSLGDQKLIDQLNATNVSGWQQQTMVALMNPIDMVMLAYSGNLTGSEIMEDFEHLLDLSH